MPRRAATRPSPAFDPVGCVEIADRLGVKPQTVIQWGFRGLLPEPAATVSGNACWNWPTIEEWAVSTGRA